MCVYYTTLSIYIEFRTAKNKLTEKFDWKIHEYSVSINKILNL